VSFYADRFYRQVPPRDGSKGPAGACRTLACNASTAAVELDNDVLQLPYVPQPGAPTGAVAPGTYGRALVHCMAEGNDLYLNFGQTNAVVANSAATTGNTQALYLPKGVWVPPFELDPAIDKWLSARTINGGGLTATLRYRVVSFPERSTP
jgi:hypothetical protein